MTDGPLSADPSSEAASAPAGGGPTIVRLIPSWDAALTYDVLAPSATPGAGDDPVFVGREALLGSLVNAISEPDRRGTYLVSGYRGAGKSSLVIEAARRAQPRLTAVDRSLLPLVLNVSEVSASLETADGGRKTPPPLEIDARRLLTALLRSLRNNLGVVLDPKSVESAELIAKVAHASDKSEASHYLRKARDRTETSTLRTVESNRSVQVANLLRLLAAIAAIAFLAVEGVAILRNTTASLQAVCLALAGVAVVSFGTSRRHPRRRGRSCRATSSCPSTTRCIRSRAI